MTNASSAPRLVTGTRNGRYGEVLLVNLNPDGIRLEVYNSYMLNDCPEELWEKLSTQEIEAATGAARAVLNGPRYWMMDGIGKVNNVEPVVRDFGGITMRLAATIPVDTIPERSPYSEVTVNRGALFYFDAHSTVYQLTDPNGKVYVLQAYCTGVDPTLTIETLGELGARLALPDGWRFSSRVVETELAVDTTTEPATVVQDELENTYTLVR